MVSPAWRVLTVAGALLVLLAGRIWGAGAVPDVVRWDGYFRESLRAISDWEDVLAAWEAGTPEEERTPVLPVPESGDGVEWPNPFPTRLVPPADTGQRVWVRAGGDQAMVQRMLGEGDPTEETVAFGDTVLGYKHPGGGEHDRWYHGFTRRFDRLATFTPRPAPFALDLAAPRDFVRGRNTLNLGLRNVTPEPLTLTVRLESRSSGDQGSEREQRLTLGPGESTTVGLPVELWAEGGRLLVLTVEAPEGRYWLPLLTYVEDISSVLASLAQILEDTPDSAAAAQVASLRRVVEGVPPAEPLTGAEWRGLFERASSLRDELLLRRLDFGALLFTKRKPFDSEQPFMDAHHLRNRPGGAVYRLSPVRPDGQVTPVVDSLGEGIYRDICLHWDATRFVFAFGNGSDAWDGAQSYHIYEANADGSGLRQLTEGAHNDCEPFYLPDGRIGFTSDRSEHFVMCGGDRHAPTLFAMNADGSGLQQLSYNCFNDFSPSVLPDGRILYSRWEYNERSVTSLHNPFTMQPDGTMVSPYYGNATFRPNVVMFPRPVPGSGKVMALLTAHHGQTHGPVSLIDVGLGVDGPGPLTLLTPHVPVTAEKIEDSRYGWYSDPVPLSETTYLCSYTPTVVPWLEWGWGLYIGDQHGNLALVYRAPEISCAEPVPLVPRPRPHVVPRVAGTETPGEGEARLLLQDVHIGLTGVPRGEARWLRIVEDVPRKSIHHGGVVCTAATGIYTIKRIFGTVPVEPDGSAHFVVPADRNVYFEVLDAQQREIQRMRSVVCLRPGETRTCVGCHEPRTTAPPNQLPAAAQRAPSQPVPPAWGTATISFLRDVQPLLNDKCVQCHTHDRMANGVILTDDLTDQFSVSYQELVSYVATANAMRWDYPEDVFAQPPYSYGSAVSRLTQVLDAGHHGVELSDEEWQRLLNWMDANGVYYDTYETGRWGDRRIFTGEVRKALDDVYGRRCAECHGEGDGAHDTWWLSLNRRDAALSRALQAPLSAAAGGWQRCGEPVFASTEEADYQALRGALTALGEALAAEPREDLLSLQGTPAEGQPVTLPAPPPPRPAGQEPALEGDWAYLSDLGWEQARAGWTRTGDGLPRRDRDVLDGPLRVGLRRYRKGIGTHAPSEVVYRVGGEYARFHAMVGNAEQGGTVVFQVFGDDECLYDSGVLSRLADAREVDVPVAGVQTLRLVVTDAGDGMVADMANWADARLLRTAGQG